MNLFDRIIGKKNDKGRMELVPDPLQMKMYSKEQSAEQGFNSLRASITTDSDKWHAKFERMESEQAQGEPVNEEEMQDLRDRAIAYGNMEAAFATSDSMPAPERIKHAIAFLKQYVSQSPESQRPKMLELIDRLRGL